MALINCPECGKEVSDQAKNCPNCGYSFRKQNHLLSLKQYKNNKKVIFGLCGVGILVLCMLFSKPIINSIKSIQHNNNIKNDKIAPELTYSGSAFKITRYDNIDSFINILKNKILATDNLTPADKLIIDVKNKKTVDTSLPGKYNLTVTATDEAGNEGKITLSVEVIDEYAEDDIIMYHTIGTGVTKLKNILKDPNSLAILGMSYDQSNDTAYYYYTATNSFNASISSYCSYTKNEQDIYAPQNDSNWEINLLKMQYENAENVSVSSYNEYVDSDYNN